MTAREGTTGDVDIFMHLYSPRRVCRLSIAGTGEKKDPLLASDLYPYNAGCWRVYQPFW
jgi:hypothetical protein